MKMRLSRKRLEELSTDLALEFSRHVLAVDNANEAIIRTGDRRPRGWSHGFGQSLFWKLLLRKVEHSRKGLSDRDPWLEKLLKESYLIENYQGIIDQIVEEAHRRLRSSSYGPVIDADGTVHQDYVHPVFKERLPAT